MENRIPNGVDAVWLLKKFLMNYWRLKDVGRGVRKGEDKR